MENKEIDEKIAFLTKAYNSLEEIYKKNPIPDNVKDWKDKVIPKLYGTNKIKISRIEIIRFPSDSYSFQMEKDIHEYEVARTVIVDTGIKLTLDNNLKDSLEIRKLLKAREDNIDFELQLAEMITGDNNKFPDRKSFQLTEFFQNLGYSYVYSGETRKYWVKEILEELDIKKIYKLITTGLFRKKYFLDYEKETHVSVKNLLEFAKNEFKQFIENSITANEAFDLSSVLDMNVNIELLFDNKADTNDIELNKLIEDSKDRFVSNDRQVAIEKLWDAFERLKTYFLNEGLKKNLSAEKIVNLVSEDFDKNFMNEEFDKLTKIGNDYRIRHHETNRKELKPVHLNYFYFRMLALIDLCLVYLKKEEDSLEDLF